MCRDSLVARDVPWRPRLEEFDEVSLEVPDQYLARLTSGVVLLVRALFTLLELVRGRH